MQKLIIILAFVLIVFITFALSVERKKGRGKKAYQYKKKEFFMTRAEHECYDALINAVGNEFYIFPQIHLATILDNKMVGQNWKGAFRHIDEKSVDFVLCNKNYISPILAIELDDSSHDRQDRRDRDIEVERILMDSGLRLLRLNNKGYFNSEELAKQINTALI